MTKEERLVLLLYENYKNVVCKFVLHSWPEIEEERLRRTLRLTWVMASLRGKELRGMTGREQSGWLLAVAGQVIKAEKMHPCSGSGC